MAFVTGTKKNGSSWTPQFVTSIDKEVCIGCARCFKSCAYGCLGPYEIEDAGNKRRKLHRLPRLLKGMP